MELSKNEKKALLVIVFFLFIGAVVRFYAVFSEREKASEVIIPVNETGGSLPSSNPLSLPEYEGEAAEEEPKKAEKTEKGEIVVHVCGAVKKPGVYNLPPKSRVEDFIEAAGGPLEDADLNSINLARIPEDGEQIPVPSIKDKKEEAEKENPLIKTKEPGITKEGKVNINSATLGELDILPGVGPVIAQRIIDFRKLKGDFKTVEDIKKVSGIGEKTFEDIKDYIVVK